MIWISSWVGQKEILRWLTQEAAERGDHLTVIVPTNNGMGWHGEDPVPSEYLRMPRRSSQGPTMPHWPRIHKKSNRPPDVRLGYVDAAASFLLCFDTFLRPGELRKKHFTWAGGSAVLSEKTERRRNDGL